MTDPTPPPAQMTQEQQALLLANKWTEIIRSLGVPMLIKDIAAAITQAQAAARDAALEAAAVALKEREKNHINTSRECRGRGDYYGAERGLDKSYETRDCAALVRGMKRRP